MRVQGERCHLSKLTHVQVTDIYTSDKPQKVFCYKYSIKQPGVSHIKSGLNWKHITCSLKRGGVVYRRYAKRLTEDQVRYIYSSSMDYKSLARKFNTTYEVIANIKVGINWNKITIGLVRGGKANLRRVSNRSVS